MTKTQTSENHYNAVMFNFTRHKLIFFLIIGALAVFGVYKLLAYTGK